MYDQPMPQYGVVNPTATPVDYSRRAVDAPPQSTLQKLSIGLAEGTIKDQAGVNQLYGNPEYGSAVPEATPYTSRYTASPMQPPTPATPETQQQQDVKSGQTNQFGYSSAGARLANPNPVNPAIQQNAVSGGMSTGVSRYGLGSTDAEKQAEDYLSTFEKPKTEQELAAEKTKGAQDVINSINENFNNALLDQSRLNDQRSSETNAQSVLSGLSGSTEAGTRAMQTGAFNTQENKKLYDQKALALSTLYNQIRNDAATEARQSRLDARTSAESVLARKEANTTKAEKSVQQFAQTGATFDGLKKSDPQTFAYLAQSVGGEAQLKALFVLNTPGDTILDKKIEGGKYIIVTQNPLTGATKVQTLDLGLPDEYTESADLGDRIMFFPKGDPTKAIYAAKAPDELKKLQIANAQADLQKKQNALGTGAGGDFYTAERAQRTIDAVNDIKKQVNGMTVGYGSLLSSIPESQARNFRANLDTLKANIGFTELKQMRDASKTGGALGQVSDRELTLLTSVLGGLDQGQSVAAFNANLDKISASIQRWQTAVAANGGVVPSTDNSGDVDPQIQELRDAGYSDEQIQQLTSQ